jgi:hypothetical protein
LTYRSNGKNGKKRKTHGLYTWGENLNPYAGSNWAVSLFTEKIGETVKRLGHEMRIELKWFVRPWSGEGPADIINL